MRFFEKTAPRMVGIGAQKCGTSSLSSLGQQFGGCTASGKEAHFFDDPKFRSRAPEQGELNVYFRKWRRGNCPVNFEISPSYVSTASAPSAICGAFAGRDLPMLVLLLRNPVDRSHSSYYQYESQPFGFEPTGWHDFASLDVDVARTCGLPPLVDDSFGACCDAVARRHGREDWPGCGCDPASVLEDIKRTVSRTNYRHGGRCTPWGDRKYSVVRESAYVGFLRRWFAIFKPDRILMYRSEDFFLDQEAAAEEIFRASHRVASSRAGAFVAAADARRAPSRAPNLTSSRASSHHNERPPAEDRTLALLRGFFAPLNVQLEALLGKRLGWNILLGDFGDDCETACAGLECTPDALAAAHDEFTVERNLPRTVRVLGGKCREMYTRTGVPSLSRAGVCLSPPREAAFSCADRRDDARPVCACAPAVPLQPNARS